jgi:flagellar hook-associated protein 1 FlgK
MSGLFSALQTASSALSAFSQALGVDESNIANASTPGYAAQRANIVPFNAPGTNSNAADSVTVTSSGDVFADALVRAASSQAGASQTNVQQMTPVNQLFDITGQTGILAAFQQFSKAFANLAVTPNDATAGSIALNAAGQVAAAFGSVVASLDTQKQQVAARIQNTTEQINHLATDLAHLNAEAGSSPQEIPSVDAGMRNDLDQLSSLVDISVIKSPNGTVSVLAGGQLPLVLGDQAYTLSVNPNAAPGTQVSSSGGGNSPTSFSGQLGALLGFQNNTIAALIGGNGQTGGLNTLAAGFANLVNTALKNGTTSAGSPGTPIFTYDQTNPVNAARSLAVAPNLTPSDLGLADTTSSNGVANYLAALPGSTAAGDQIAGFSAEELFGSIASSAGQQLSDATTASTADQTALTAAQTNRQQVSGVSLDQEAVSVTAFERAYQANAQVVSILNQMTQDTINLIGPTGG